jgi:hypothetical protein
MIENTKFKELVRKIVSGGQTGADKGALVAAYENGISTGGVAPKGWMTENGPDLTLVTKFKLTESDSADYTVRTLKNVKTTDCTLIFCDKKSKGSLLTEKYCLENNKPFLVMSTVSLSEKDLEKIKYFVNKIFFEKGRAIFINVAGNRESKVPGIENRVREILTKLILLY